MNYILGQFNGNCVKRFALKTRYQLFWRKYLPQTMSCRLMTTADNSRNHSFNYDIITRNVFTLTAINVLRPNLIMHLNQKRYKKAKKSGKTQEEESEDEDDDEEGIQGYTDVEVGVMSLKVLDVARHAFGIPREKMEDSTVSAMRLNGQRIVNKNDELRVNDVFDFVRGVNRENIDLIDIKRVIIQSIADKAIKGKIKIKFRKFGSQSIENYSKDPFEGITFTERKEETEINKRWK